MLKLPNDPSIWWEVFAAFVLGCLLGSALLVVDMVSRSLFPTPW